MARKKSSQNNLFATLPLRDMVVYPHMVLPLFVGRPKSVAALRFASEHEQPVFLLAQKIGSEEEPDVDNLHETGTIAKILQVLNLPDGTIKVLVEGVSRAQVIELNDTGEFLQANVMMLAQTEDSSDNQEALRRTLLSQFEQLIKKQ